MLSSLASWVASTSLAKIVASREDILQWLTMNNPSGEKVALPALENKEADDQEECDDEEPEEEAEEGKDLVVDPDTAIEDTWQQEAPGVQVKQKPGDVS